MKKLRFGEREQNQVVASFALQLFISFVFPNLLFGGEIAAALDQLALSGNSSLCCVLFIDSAAAARVLPELLECL
jgi:hypothetical protein